MARLDVYNLGQWHELAWRAGYNAAALSKLLQISQRQLQRYTQRIFGHSPQDWLDQQRLDAAVGLLKKHRCVKHVSYQLGFKQASHFSREFKLRYGMSPSEFLIWSDQRDVWAQNVRHRYAMSVSDNSRVLPASR